MKNSAFSFETASQTHCGMLRSNNEDSLFAFDSLVPGESWFSSFGLYIISDGMGGHRGGEIASAIAIRIVSMTLLDNLERINEFQNPFSLVKEALEEANKEIYKVAGAKPELRTMGTTLTMGLRLDNEVFIGHVGDSRAYLVRGQTMVQLTTDHSLVTQLLREGIIMREEVNTHPDKHVILRCLGLSGGIDVDEKKLILQNHDCLIFCSDGLTNQVTDNEIFDVVTTQDMANKACETPINLANTGGGEDNISVVVVKVKSNLEIT